MSSPNATSTDELFVKKSPRSTPKRIANSRTWSTPRNMDWLNSNDDNNNNNKNIDLPASPSLKTTLFPQTDTNSTSSISSPSSSPGFIQRKNWKKQGVVVENAITSSLKKMKRTPPKQFSNNNNNNNNNINNNNYNIGDEGNTDNSKSSIAGLADPSLLSRVDALLERSRQRDEWEKFSGYRSRRDDDDHQEIETIANNNNNKFTSSFNFTSSVQTDVGINNNNNDDDDGDNNAHAAKIASKNKSLTSISESLYLHEKCGRLHRALFMTNHTGENRISTSNLTVLLEDAQEAAEQSYKSLMVARRDLLTSYLGKDAAEAMIASTNIKTSIGQQNSPTGGTNNNNNDNNNLNSPSNRMNTLRSTLQHMVALPHTSTVSFEQQLTQKDTLQQSNIGRNYVDSALNPKNNIGNNCNEPAIPNTSYVKIAEEMYNTNQQKKNNRSSSISSSSNTSSTKKRELLLLSPKAKRKNPNISTPNERLETLNKSLSNMLNGDSVTDNGDDRKSDEEEEQVAQTDPTTLFNTSNNDDDDDKANVTLMNELEKNLNNEIEEDLQVEKEFKSNMEIFSKTVEDDVESITNIVKANNNILSNSGINGNNVKETKTLETLSIDPMPWTGKVENDDDNNVENKRLEVSPHSPSLKRLKQRLNTGALPSPLQRLQDFRKNLQGVLSFQTTTLSSNDRYGMTHGRSSNSSPTTMSKSKSALSSYSSSLFDVETSPRKMLNAVDEREKLPLPRHKVLLSNRNVADNNLLNKVSVDGETQSRLTFLNSRVDNIKATIKRIADGDAGSGKNSYSTYESDDASNIVVDSMHSSSGTSKKTSSSMISPRSPKEILKNMVDKQRY